MKWKRRLNMTLVEARMECLKSMDSYIRDEIIFSEDFDLWLSEGIPDEANEDNYRYIAEHDKEFTNVCKLFYKYLLKKD
jgi:hypothetical protein